MPMYLQDEVRGPVEISTIAGWTETADWVEQNYPATEFGKFVSTGISEKPKEFMDSIAKMEPYASANVRGVFKAIKRFMKAEPLLIMLSDGTVK